MTVEPGEVTREEVRLILGPGEKPEEEVLPPVASTTKAAAGGGLRVPAAAWGVLGGARWLRAWARSSGCPRGGRRRS